MSHPRPLYIYFRLFNQTLEFLQQINSNPQNSLIESPPITTRPVLLSPVTLLVFNLLLYHPEPLFKQPKQYYNVEINDLTQ